MNFDWREHQGEDLRARFPDGVFGYEAWTGLLIFLESHLDSKPPLSPDFWQSLIDHFDSFLVDIDTVWGDGREVIARRQGDPTVFISHQSRDTAYGERIAYLACGEKLNYWLDIHDPVLSLANRTVPPTSSLFPFIIAAIIEIALLNCECVIAVHTANSLGSKWVPYELGRARNRKIHSLMAGGWFHPAIVPVQCGEFVHLCRMGHGGETDVCNWLNTWSESVGGPWKGTGTPHPLP